MRVAVVLPMGTPSEVVGTARFAEETGFDGVWMYENLYAAVRSPPPARRSPRPRAFAWESAR